MEKSRVIKSLFKQQKTFYAVKTFTYFIPSPPHRRTGYQEKEFDAITHQIADMGFSIISIKTTAYATAEKSGMWAVCLLGAPNKEVFDKEVLFGSNEGSNSSNEQYVPLDPNIIHE